MFGGLGNELLDQLVKLEIDKLFEGAYIIQVNSCGT
jgi:hypothetical protein